MRLVPPRPLAGLVCLLLLLRFTPAHAIGAPFMVKDIRPGNLGSTPKSLVSLGNKLFLYASDGTSGLEPWVSDGTAAGTQPLADIWPGTGSSAMGLPVVMGGAAYFAAANGTNYSLVYRSDGTPGGTTMMYDQSTVTGFVTGGSTLYFAGTLSAGVERFLYRSDGTYAGTAPVTLNTYLAGNDVTDVNGRVFFTADDLNHGDEMWVSDGTPGGTHMTQDMVPGNSGCWPMFLTGAGGLAFYFASPPGLGWALCRSDGTNAGTFPLASIGPNTNTVNGVQIINLNGIAIVIGSDADHGRELWRSDGTVAGTFMLRDFTPGPGSGIIDPGMAVLGNFAYFAATDPVYGNELWRTDGTIAGTTMVADGSPGAGSSVPRFITALNGSLFFTASNASGGTGPWISDGTDIGTHEMGVVYPGGGPSGAAAYAYANGYVFFTAQDGVHGTELWAAAMPAVTGVTPPVGALHPGIELAASTPNPARRAARIDYRLGSASVVRLRLYDVRGRAVRTLVEGEQSAGEHGATLDVSAFTPGVYFCRLEAAGASAERKLLILR